MRAIPTNLRGTIWLGADLSNANLSRADLRSLEASGQKRRAETSTFFDADGFKPAVLDGADFTGAKTDDDIAFPEAFDAKSRIGEPPDVADFAEVSDSIAGGLGRERKRGKKPLSND